MPLPGSGRQESFFVVTARLGFCDQARCNSWLTLTMEQKLSSVRIMSEAPFATSVPWMPIATPMSACGTLLSSIAAHRSVAEVSSRVLNGDFALVKEGKQLNF